MSTMMKICFDASIHEGCIGIGIYNFDTKEEIIHRFTYPEYNNKIDIMFSETVALVKTLQYLKSQNINKAHIFTDNKTLADKGISNKLANKTNYTLNWIPREFNEDADRLSKHAHSLTPLIYDFKKTQDKPSKKLKSKQLKNVYSQIMDSSFEQKLNFISNFSDSKLSKGIINSLRNGVDYNHKPNTYRRKDRMFIRLIHTFLNESEKKGLLMEIIDTNNLSKFSPSFINDIKLKTNKC